MDAPTTVIGAIAAAVVLLLQTIQGIALSRVRGQTRKIETLELNADRDATLLEGLEAWQFQARRYFAQLANALADRDWDLPPPPTELGLRRVGTRMTAGSPPTKRSRHRVDDEDSEPDSVPGSPGGDPVLG